MFGILLTSISTFLGEVSTSIGKDKVQQNKLSVYSFGVIENFFLIIFLFIIIVFKQKFIFSLASLPTFTARVIIEMILVLISINAVCRAGRSTNGFIRVITLPLLLVVDLLLGYKISNFQLLGIGIIIFTLILIFFNQGIKKTGAVLTLISALLAVATISLYKYNISHFNSVEAEQFLVCLIIFIFLFLLAKFLNKEKPFSYFRQPIFLMQSLISGAGGLGISFAFLFAPASVIMTAVRSFSVFWSVISGKIYFKEKNVLLKIILFLLLFIGIIFLVF